MMLLLVILNSSSGACNTPRAPTVDLQGQIVKGVRKVVCLGAREVAQFHECVMHEFAELASLLIVWKWIAHRCVRCALTFELSCLREPQASVPRIPECPATAGQLEYRVWRFVYLRVKKYSKVV
jgi:hypothetical protein